MSVQVERARTGAPLIDALLFGAACAGLAWFLSFGRDTIYNNYTILAQAFAAGHIWIVPPGMHIDAVAFEGRYYVVEAPIPALLAVPIVAAFGTMNQTVYACMLAGAGMALAWELSRRIGTARITDRALILLFFFFGTDLAWCAVLGDVWVVAHLCAVMFTLGALVELFGPRPRTWLVLLCAVLAAGSRFSVAGAIPIYGAWIWRTFGTTMRPARFWLGLGAVLVPAGVLFVMYNEMRWHVPLDRGYWIWYQTVDPLGDPRGSPFGLAFLPYELRSFFVNAFTLSDKAPYVIPGIAGQSLVVTAPAYAIACFARAPRQGVVFLWALVVVTALPNLLYYSNGIAQFGMRHALDFAPFLLALMLLRAKAGPLALWQSLLCLYSSAIGGYGIWYWNTQLRVHF